MRIQSFCRDDFARYFSKGDALAHAAGGLCSRFMLSKGMTLQICSIRIEMFQSTLLSSRPLKKSCVIAVSRVRADKILNAGLDCRAQMMAAYVMHFLAILSRSGSTRPPMICQHPLQAREVFIRQTVFIAASLLFPMSTGGRQAMLWYLLYLMTASPFVLAMT